jgi:hypothetical protein
MLAAGITAPPDIRQHIVNPELPDRSTVFTFPIALAPGSDMLLTRK